MNDFANLVCFTEFWCRGNSELYGSCKNPWKKNWTGCTCACIDALTCESAQLFVFSPDEEQNWFLSWQKWYRTLYLSFRTFYCCFKKAPTHVYMILGMQIVCMCVRMSHCCFKQAPTHVYMMLSVQIVCMCVRMFHCCFKQAPTHVYMTLSMQIVCMCVGVWGILSFEKYSLFSAAVSFKEMLRKMNEERADNEEERAARADNALTKATFVAVRRSMKRLHNEEDDAVMPMRNNKAPHISSGPSTTRRTELKNFVRKTSMVQWPQSDAKTSSSLSLLGAYCDSD